MALLLPDVWKRFCVLPEARVMGSIPPRDTRGSGWGTEWLLGFDCVTLVFFLLCNYSLPRGMGQRVSKGIWRGWGAWWGPGWTRWESLSVVAI